MKTSQSLPKATGSQNAETKTSKIKYWTACVNERGQVISSGAPYFTLKEARLGMSGLNSHRAAVVRAGKDEMPQHFAVVANI